MIAVSVRLHGRLEPGDLCRVNLVGRIVRPMRAYRAVRPDAVCLRELRSCLIEAPLGFMEALFQQASDGFTARIQPGQVHLIHGRVCHFTCTSG